MFERKRFSAPTFAPISAPTSAPKAGVIGALLSLGLAIVPGITQAADTPDKKIVVGGKDFTEQFLLAEITQQYLKTQGFQISLRTGMGSALLRQAQESGQVDVYWEYTGTSLLVYNKVKDLGALSAEENYRRVREMDDKKGIVWLKPSRANNTWAIALRKNEQAHYGLRTLSDLAAAIRSGKKLTLAIEPEFSQRPDGVPGLNTHYDFKYPRELLKPMGLGLTYDALNSRAVDLGMVTVTDGRIAAFQLATLTDDKHFFPNYAITPTVRRPVLDKYPELSGLLEKLSDQLDDSTMQGLNAQVDVERRSVETVATGFLKQKKLI